jgi:hypothetical protein
VGLADSTHPTLNDHAVRCLSDACPAAGAVGLADSTHPTLNDYVVLIRSGS